MKQQQMQQHVLQQPTVMAKDLVQHQTSQTLPLKQQLVTSYILVFNKHAYRQHLPVPHPLQRQVDQEAMKQPLNQPKQHMHIKQRRKQVSAKFCSPGSLSSYRELRKMQLQTMAHDDDLESPCNIHLANEGERSLVNANQTECATDLELMVDQNIATEYEPQAVNPSKGKKRKHRGPTKLVGEKYLVPTEGRKWAMETMDDQWRAYKRRMKSLHYYAYETNAERLKSCPKTMPKNHFRALLNYWNSEPVKEESERNKANRQLLDDRHTIGPTPYAMLCQNLKEKDPNKEEPFKAKVYKDSRERKPGKSYKTSYEKTRQNIFIGTNGRNGVSRM
ncbi:RNA polymerase-binding transcription factor DksA [Bienertia sinuspersici]